ncbi:MAG: nuclear transport factor 2 family protein [Verrucomicrobiota bacterium]
MTKRPNNYVVGAAFGLIGTVTWLTNGSGGSACLAGSCLIPLTTMAATLAVVPAVAAKSESLSQDKAIVAAVEEFHEALIRGDAEAAMKMLAPDATILESGESQTRAEYEREHLAEDIAFARATTTERAPLTIQHEGIVAWTTSTSKTIGTFDGRKIDSAGVELMVLTKGELGWRIRAIHWSNRKTK